MNKKQKTFADSVPLVVLVVISMVAVAIQMVLHGRLNSSKSKPAAATAAPTILQRV